MHRQLAVIIPTILVCVIFSCFLYLCMYVCMSVMLRNANFLYVACAGSMACACSHTVVVSGPQCTST